MFCRKRVGVNQARRLAQSAAAALSVLLLHGMRPGAAAEVTKIEVAAHLTNEGRLLVTETHHLKITKGYESDFRVFGLSVDQSIAIRKITRIDAAGIEQALVDQGLAGREVDGPDQFRYYPRGHVYYRYPPVAQKTEFLYRFEYELENAVSPAWGIGAGPDPLSPDYGFGSPWRRLQSLVADAREAWPDPERRFRLDHSVLIPEQGPNRDKVLPINYQLNIDPAWREVDPKAELARVTPAVEYRVRRLFEYVPPGTPAAATVRQAVTRYGAIAAVLVMGPLCFLAFLLLERLTGGGRLSTTEAADQFSRFASEEILALETGITPSTSLTEVLSRMAGEGKLAIDSIAPPEVEGPAEIRLRLLAPLESLPPIERKFILELFGDDGTETTSAQIRDRARMWDQSPDEPWQHSLAAAARSKPEPGLSLLSLPLILLGLWGGYQQVVGLVRDTDYVAVLLTNFLALCITFGWPKQWWHGGLPRRGLLVPLILLATLLGALQFAVNRPYAVEAWTGSAVCILAFYVATMINSRMPNRGPMKITRDLSRIRQFARAELRTPIPHLDDRWVLHLIALGLGPEIEAWQNKFGQPRQAAARDPMFDSQSFIHSAPFTGLVPPPVASDPSWADVFFPASHEQSNFDEEDEADEENSV